MPLSPNQPKIGLSDHFAPAHQRPAGLRFGQGGFWHGPRPRATLWGKCEGINGKLIVWLWAYDFGGDPNLYCLPPILN